jgi:BRO1-like domain
LVAIFIAMSKNQEYLYKDNEGPNLDHPDSLIRLACVVHRFRVPRIGTTRKLSFQKSFSTVGRADKARKLVLNADDVRERLSEACSAKKISSERVVADARRYMPMIHTILLSCKVQPEAARLDEKLVFQWLSGIEFKPEAYSSEAIMYDLTMTIVTEGLGRAASATENSVAGEFAGAARDYAAAAGIFDFLADEHLPKWIAKGSKTNPDDLPSECHAPMAKALKTLFMANGQQMAVATVLIKPGTPNYGLLAKLCLGISEQLEDFMTVLRRDAFAQMSRMDPDFFTLLAFQINIQKSLSLYCQARALWDTDDHGIAIAILSEATVAARTRESTTSVGLPDVLRTPALHPLKNDLQDLKTHMATLLRVWEKDNSSVYFESVPQHVPAGKKLQDGLQMKRKEAYQLEEVEPVLLVLPEGALHRSDSDLARELQERLNAGEE